MVCKKFPGTACPNPNRARGSGARRNEKQNVSPGGQMRDSDLLLRGKLILRQVGGNMSRVL